ncbi:hypothetical protein GcM3_213030 [Golovinomyces cichoracearum]|uniref:Uncharacterized protein n=1 Tax=Golovinomyces cichoracearum TaxID=62708 RepID=A0A420H981_9PEZI|nr:hypothetical protein GcM3_213030 [Golovinomyces cichoracearum]
MALKIPHEYNQFKPWIIVEKLNDFTLDTTTENTEAGILNTFIIQRIVWYSINEWVGDLLWEYYQDDLGKWDQEMMSKCNKTIINLLRGFLVKHGLYIPIDRKRGNDAKLLAILEETEIHEWTYRKANY